MNKGLTFAVTGANGYLGQRLVNGIRRMNLNCKVYELMHRLPANQAPSQVYFDLVSEFNAELLKQVDVLIHCAYDFQLLKWKSIYEVNVLGSKRLFEEASKAGVKKIIYISTLSSFEGCKSLYGKAKLLIEKEAQKIGAVVIRPGLIYGVDPGGMVGNLKKAVSRLPILPLIGTGRQIQYLVHEDDLTGLILKLAAEAQDQNNGRVIAAAAEKKFYFRDILKILARHQSRKVLFVPIPWQMAYWGLKCLELLGVQIQFRSDSVLSLINQDPSPPFEETRQLGVRFREFDGT